MHLPGLGLTYVPVSVPTAKVCYVLFAYGALLLLTALCLWLLARLLEHCMRRTGDTKVRLNRATVILPAAMLVLPLVVRGPVGQFIVWAANDLEHVSLDAMRKTMEEWRQNPDSSPAAVFDLAHRQSKQLAQRGSANLSVPQGDLMVWTEAEANAIAEHVMALKDSHWTLSAGNARGSGMFLLGVRYGEQIYNNTFKDTHSDFNMATALWSEFEGPFLHFRQWCEDTFGIPARLHSHAHWPPVFTVHMPSAVATHQESFEVHADAILWPRKRHGLIESLSLRPGWEEVTCRWEAQLSVLVALSLPRGGAGLDYWKLKHADGLGDGRLEAHSYDHQLGRAIIIEATRAHRLRAFASWDADGVRPRIMMHSYLIPCWPRKDGQPEIQIVGPTPR